MEKEELEKEELLQFPLPGWSLGDKNSTRKSLHPWIPYRGMGMVPGWGWEGKGGVWERGSLGRWEFGKVGIWEGGKLERWEFGKVGAWEGGKLR